MDEITINREEMLGNDVIGMINRHSEEYRRLTDEDYELHNNNRMNNNIRKNTKVKKKTGKKKSISVKKVALGASIVASLGAVSITKSNCDRYIANSVIESGVIPDGVSVGHYSNGTLISWEDDYGTRNEVGVDWFSDYVTKRAETLGYSADQVAITLDYCSFCNADIVDGSTLVGRVGEELKALGEMMIESTQEKEGRSK